MALRSREGLPLLVPSPPAPLQLGRHSSGQREESRRRAQCVCLEGVSLPRSKKQSSARKAAVWSHRLVHAAPSFAHPSIHRSIRVSVCPSSHVDLYPHRAGRARAAGCAAGCCGQCHRGAIGSFLGGNPTPGSAVTVLFSLHLPTAEHMGNLSGFGRVLLFPVPFLPFLS